MAALGGFMSEEITYWNLSLRRFFKHPFFFSSFMLEPSLERERKRILL
jgi:hypothetical protein